VNDRKNATVGWEGERPRELERTKNCHKLGASSVFTARNIREVLEMT
jgi:hypothetical protein